MKKSVVLGNTGRTGAYPFGATPRGTNAGRAVAAGGGR